MARFERFTAALTGDQIFVNVDLVATVTSFQSGALITFAKDDVLAVKEDVKNVVAQLADPT